MCERCATRRQVLLGAGAAAVAAGTGLAGGNAARARDTLTAVSLCSYAGSTSLTTLAPATRRALQEVSAVQNAVGYRGRLYVYRGDAGNALASVMRDRYGDARRVIVYRPEFMSALDRRGGPGAPLSVFAHEVGHHANNDFSSSGWRKHPWRRELGADYVAGLALGRMGYSPSDATRALRLMFRQYGSRTHPDTPRRLEAMLAGWRDGGRRESLDLMR